MLDKHINDKLQVIIVIVYVLHHIIGWSYSIYQYQICIYDYPIVVHVLVLN